MRKFGIVLLFLAIGSQAYSQVAFSTFFGSDQWDTTSGYSVNGPQRSSAQRVAMKFVPVYGGEVDYIRLVTGWNIGDQSLEVRLRADSGGALGAVLGAWSYVDSVFPGIHTVHNSDPNISLAAGSTYWLDVRAEADGSHGWMFSRIEVPLGTRAVSHDDGGSWNYAEGRRLATFDVAVVPEPASASAVVIGSLLFYRNTYFRRRRLSGQGR